VRHSCRPQANRARVCAAQPPGAPVKFLMSPALAFLYSPFGSRASHTSSGMFMNTSRNSPVGRGGWQECKLSSLIKTYRTAALQHSSTHTNAA
jgi:hypothetical protein